MTTAAAARVERALLSYVKVSETSDDLRVNLNLLSDLNVALFLKRVTAEEAVAEEAVSLLRVMTDEYNFNF
jgi:hypothetical protein